MGIGSLLEGAGCLYELRPGEKPTFHFVSQDRHFDGYCNLSALSAEATWQIAEALASAVPDDSTDIGAVVSVSVPPNSVFAYLVALHLSQLAHDLHVAHAWVWQGDEGRMNFDDHVPAKIVGKKVVVVQGAIIAKTEPTKKLVKFVRQHGGIPVALATVIGPAAMTREDIDVPALIRLHCSKFQSWKEDGCKVNGPCAKGVPLVIDRGWGTGQKLRRDHPDWPESRFTRL